MSALYDFLTTIDVELKDLLLDPNNPRFAELGEEVAIIPDSRYGEPKVQKVATERMRSRLFDVSELRDTIKTIGFLPMDRIVVRKWKGVNSEDEKYVVVEGNRRIAALKWLMELHDAGKETFEDKQIENFTKLGALLLDDEKAPDSAIWVLPGLRHVSGIKQWGPYQRARAVYILRESGETPQEAAQSLGLSTRAANALWRAYLALEQMQRDEEFSEYAEPKKYSYFEEVLKRPNVREWLEWSDDERKFVNSAHLKEFYGWVVGEMGDEGEPGEPKLPEAKSIRDLGKIIDDDVALNVFRSEGGSLVGALVKYEAEHPEDWRPVLANAELVLSSLTPDILRKFTEQDITTLTELGARIDQVLKDRGKLMVN